MTQTFEIAVLFGSQHPSHATNPQAIVNHSSFLSASGNIFTASLALVISYETQDCFCPITRLEAIV